MTESLLVCAIMELGTAAGSVTVVFLPVSS